MVFVPDNYEAIGSCVLSIDPVKTGDCVISDITVLIWDRVLQLAIVGLLIGYARDFAAGMGFHHLLVRKVESVVEGILRVIGWEDCGCKGLRVDGGVGLCGGSWTAKKDGQSQDIGQPEYNGQPEQIEEMEEESDSGDGVVSVETDVMTEDQARGKITLDELIEAAAQEDWDLVMGARQGKRSFDELETASADEPATSKRTKVEFNGCCGNGSLYRQREQIKHNTVIETGSSPSKISGPSSASEKPASQAPKVTMPPIIRAPLLRMNDDLSPVKNESEQPRLRGSRGRGDRRNARMRLAASSKAAQGSASSEIRILSEQLSLFQKPYISEKPPKEPIERGVGTSKMLSTSSDTISSSMLEAPSHPSSVATSSENSAFLPIALNSEEPTETTLNSTGHDRGMLDDIDSTQQRPEAILALEVQALMDKFQGENNERIDPANPAQRPEAKLTLKVPSLLGKVQRDNRDRTEPATQAMRNLNLQSPTNAILVSENVDMSAKGAQGTSRMSNTTLNTPGKDHVRFVMKSHVPKTAQVNGDLKWPTGLKTRTILVPDNVVKSTKGAGNTSRTSRTTLDTSGKDNVRSVIMSRVPENAQVNGGLKRPAGHKTQDMKDSPATLLASPKGDPPEPFKNSPPSAKPPSKLSTDTWLGSPVRSRKAASDVLSGAQRRLRQGDFYRPRY